MLDRMVRLETYLAEALKIPTEEFSVAIGRFKAAAEFNETEQFNQVASLEFEPVASQHDFKIRRDYLLTIQLKNQINTDLLINNLLAWMQSEGLMPTLNGMLERNNQQTLDLFIDLEVTELSRNTPQGRVITC